MASTGRYSALLKEGQLISFVVAATVDGVEYTIPNVQLRKAGATVVSESSESHAGHDHGHGDNSNSGGGAGGR